MTLLMKKMKFNIFGCGGQCSVVLSILKTFGALDTEITIFDPFNNSKDNEIVYGHKVVNLLDRPVVNFLNAANFIALGNLGQRKEFLMRFHGTGTHWPALIDRTANVDQKADIGRGTIVCAGAHIGPFAAVGENCLINTNAIIEHEVVVKNHVNLSPGAVICGRSKIGDSVSIGAGSVVLDKLDIASGCLIGANSTVLTSFESPGRKIIGSPAKDIGDAV